MATIYHNPKCGTSRNTLALLLENGLDVEVVEYLQTGWTKELLENLLVSMNVSAQSILRVRGTNAEELGLTNSDLTDEILIDAMIANPILVNRPIVSTSKGVKLCRPADEVLELL
jgi:arsenate reductase